MIVVVEDHEQPVEVGCTLSEAGSQLFLGSFSRACLLAHPSDMAQHVACLLLHRYHHVHPEKKVFLGMQVSREEGGGDEVLDEWVMLG